jgi:signal transduction histidine kinase
LERRKWWEHRKRKRRDRSHTWSHEGLGPEDWQHWDHRHHHGPPVWLVRGRRQRRFLFFRILGIFGVVVLLILGFLAALAFVLSRLFGGGGETTVLLWFAAIGLTLAFPLLAAAVAVRAFRSIAMPLADLVAAADAVAEGDLSARVPVYDDSDFGQLAQSFNHMVEELQRADEQRRNLTADIAHELRTPLQIIQGNLEGVLDEVYDPTPEHLDATLEETRALARLVDDLRTLSLAESGQLPMMWEQCNVGELLEDICTSFMGQAEAAGITLTTQTMGDNEAMTITADVGRVDQVLGNLLSNALRHTPRGGSVTLCAQPADDVVRITVRDTGEGIAAEDLPFVFDRFWRADRSRSRLGGAGSGLGLAIVRQLVQAHGGQISVSSTPGQGTTFTIDLPTTPPAAGDTQTPQSPA